MVVERGDWWEFLSGNSIWPPQSLVRETVDFGLGFVPVVRFLEEARRLAKRGMDWEACASQQGVV